MSNALLDVAMHQFSTGTRPVVDLNVITGQGHARQRGGSEGPVLNNSMRRCVPNGAVRPPARNHGGAEQPGTFRATGYDDPSLGRTTGALGGAFVLGGAEGSYTMALAWLR